MTEVKSQNNSRLTKGPSAKKASQTKVASEFAALLKQARYVKPVESDEGSASTEEKDALSSGTLARVKNISKERRSAKDVQDNYDDADKQNRNGTSEVQDTDSSNDTGEELEDDETSCENLKKAPLNKNATQDKKLATEFSNLLAQARITKKGESSASEEDILDEKEVMSKGTVARVKHISNMRRISSIKVKNKKTETPKQKNNEEKIMETENNKILIEKSSAIIKDDHLLKHADTMIEKIAKKKEEGDKVNPYENVIKKRTAPKVPEHNESKKSPIVMNKITSQQPMKNDKEGSEINSKARKEVNANKIPETATKKRAAPIITEHSSKSQQSKIEIERAALQQLIKNTETKNENNHKGGQLEDANNTSELVKKKRPAPKLTEQNKSQPSTSLKKTTLPHQIKENNDDIKKEVDSPSNPVEHFKRKSLKKSAAPKLPVQNKLPLTTPLKETSPDQIKEKGDNDTNKVDNLSKPVINFKISSLKKNTSTHQIKENTENDKQDIEILPTPVANFNTTPLKKTTSPLQIKNESDRNKQEVDTRPNPVPSFNITSLKKTSLLQNKDNSVKDKQEVDTLSNPVANSKIIKQLNNTSAEKIDCSSDDDKSSKIKGELDFGNIMTKDEDAISKEAEVELRSFSKKSEYYLIKDDKPTELEEYMKLMRNGSRRSSEDLRAFNKKKFLKDEKRRSSLEDIFHTKLDKGTESKELNVKSRIVDESSREVQRKALKELHNQARHHTHPECAYGNMIPEPDYSDDEQAEANTKSSSAIVNRNNTFNNAISKDPLQDRFDEKGLIIPKKLVNPNLEASEKKNLHRELKFNAKAVFEENRKERGVNVLNQKTELQKALEKQKDKKAVKELEVQRQEELNPLQKALHERAQKIEKETEKTDNKNSENDKNSSEFEKVHAKLRGKMEV